MVNPPEIVNISLLLYKFCIRPWGLSGQEKKKLRRNVLYLYKYLIALSFVKMNGLGYIRLEPTLDFAKGCKLFFLVASHGALHEIVYLSLLLYKFCINPWLFYIPQWNLYSSFVTVFITEGLPGRLNPWTFVISATEQHYVLMFLTRLWSVRKPLPFDTQNPGISGFSTAHAHRYKTKRQTKMKWN